jgi:hypothetical protein
MANPGSQKYTDIPLEIAGSTKFGRYSKMSSEQTYNMIVSDGWLVPFAGFKNVSSISPNGVGRGIYTSTKLNRMFAVIDDGIYIIDASLTYQRLITMTTSVGDVFISENNNVDKGGEVAFSDGSNLYIYTGNTNTVTKILFGAGGVDFRPGYLTYQNGRLICPDLLGNQWRLSELNQALTAADWPTRAQNVGALQTKPDKTVACVRMPGKGNMILVFGRTVTEQWYDVGAAQFPYQRSQSSNLDYGCLNPATIAESENVVCWLAVNEKSGPVIMMTDGGQIQHLSTDGIDFKLATLTNPSDSYGFMFKQDGHLFYVITFVTDELTYAYDFKSQAFYTLSNENLSYFPAKRVAFFNDQYYFVSIDDGNLYQLGTQFTNYEYNSNRIEEAPRIRILPSITMPDQSYFVAGYSGFTIEQGQSSLTQRVDMSLSKDGGVNYGSNVSIQLNPLGKRKNRLMFWNLGMCNDLVHQYRFYGLDRFVATNGICGIYQ